MGSNLKNISELKDHQFWWEPRVFMKEPEKGPEVVRILKNNFRTMVIQQNQFFGFFFQNSGYEPVLGASLI